MTTEKAFLSDAAEHPEDDAPRLVYADWLDEQGRSDYAELIRVQCRLASSTPDAPDYVDLEERLRELNRFIDVGTPAGWPRLRHLEYETDLERGFPDSVEVEVDAR